MIAEHFGIGIYQAKRAANVGMLWRGAYQLGAAYLFTVGRRYKPEPTDTVKAWLRIPLFSYDTIEQMHAAAPRDCHIVGIEMGGIPLTEFDHPAGAVYILGAEDGGLPTQVQSRCHQIVTIPAIRDASYNVAQAGTIVLYDRMVKGKS